MVKIFEISKMDRSKITPSPDSEEINENETEFLVRTNNSTNVSNVQGPLTSSNNFDSTLHVHETNYAIHSFPEISNIFETTNTSDRVSIEPIEQESTPEPPIIRFFERSPSDNPEPIQFYNLSSDPPIQGTFIRPFRYHFTEHFRGTREAATQRFIRELELLENEPSSLALQLPENCYYGIRFENLNGLERTRHINSSDHQNIHLENDQIPNQQLGNVRNFRSTVGSNYRFVQRLEQRSENDIQNFRCSGTSTFLPSIDDISICCGRFENTLIAYNYRTTEAFVAILYITDQEVSIRNIQNIFSEYDINFVFGIRVHCLRNFDESVVTSTFVQLIQNFVRINRDIRGSPYIQTTYPSVPRIFLNFSRPNRLRSYLRNRNLRRPTASYVRGSVRNRDSFTRRPRNDMHTTRTSVDMNFSNDDMDRPRVTANMDFSSNLDIRNDNHNHDSTLSENNASTVVAEQLTNAQNRNVLPQTVRVRRPPSALTRSHISRPPRSRRQTNRERIRNIPSRIRSTQNGPGSSADFIDVFFWTPNPDTNTSRNTSSFDIRNPSISNPDDSCPTMEDVANTRRTIPVITLPPRQAVVNSQRSFDIPNSSTSNPINNSSPNRGRIVFNSQRSVNITNPSISNPVNSWPTTDDVANSQRSFTIPNSSTSNPVNNSPPVEAVVNSQRFENIMRFLSTSSSVDSNRSSGDSSNRKESVFNRIMAKLSNQNSSETIHESYCSQFLSETFPPQTPENSDERINTSQDYPLNNQGQGDSMESESDLLSSLSFRQLLEYASSLFRPSGPPSPQL